MRYEFTGSGIAVQIAPGITPDPAFPTGRIQKGLVLFCDGQDLSEEAVGFGVPVLKRGLQAVFPGAVELQSTANSNPGAITARFKMNLVEKVARAGSGAVNSKLIYTIKDLLAAMIRNIPSSRSLLTRASNLVRASFGWKTTYESINPAAELVLNYSLDAQGGTIAVELNRENNLPDGITELIIMDEQGANPFDRYQDTGGNRLEGGAIGCWDRVFAAEAEFISTLHQVSFSLPQVQGARLYRGRERIGSRLAWAGFGYTFPPTLDHFRTIIKLKRLR